MGVSPFRQWLYRTVGAVVICLLPAMRAIPQGNRPKPSPGPRALGLVEITKNGKAHLIPISVMVDGQFYDASAYKATPVPMSLESGVVYEGFKTGVSQGLFTVNAAGQTSTSWIGIGTWKVAGSEPPKKPADTTPKEDTDAPPRLRRPGAEKPQPQPEAPTTPPPAPAPGASTTPAPESLPDDSGRPVLRRGKPAPKPEEKEDATALATVGKLTARASVDSGVQLIPAISDAGGPESRPYIFKTKPEEEAEFRKKMLDLATDAVSDRAKQLTPLPPGTSVRKPARSAATAKPSQPSFDHIRMQVVDLSNSNEPILVLNAEAQMPTGGMSYFVAVVARQDIYGELHKVSAQIADSQHLDALPQMEFIDAVDADGDGRGELLFRRRYDSGSAFSIFRVIGDRLWPLFEGSRP
jgi:hypothetical protein